MYTSILFLRFSRQLPIILIMTEIYVSRHHWNPSYRQKQAHTRDLAEKKKKQRKIMCTVLYEEVTLQMKIRKKTSHKHAGNALFSTCGCQYILL